MIPRYLQLHINTECPFVQIEVVQENSGQRFIYLFYLLPLLPNNMEHGTSFAFIAKNENAQGHKRCAY